MNDMLLPDKTGTLTREYLNYPSLVLREVKACTLLSQGAKHCWELLFDLSKFDSRREITICINDIAKLLNKHYRTAQRYISQLVSEGFLKTKYNFCKLGKAESSYSVLIPEIISSKIESSTKKVFIEPVNSGSTPENSANDNIVASNKELKIKDNNNCYLYKKEEKEEQIVNALEQCDISNLEDDIVEYYPAKEKEVSPTKAVLRHALTAPVKFEKAIGQTLTKAQEFVVSNLIAFWQRLRYISSPSECMNWITTLLLNPKALSDCGNNFLKKINVINKLIREKRFSKPFVERYKEKEAQTNSKEIGQDRSLAQDRSGISPLLHQAFSTVKELKTHRQSVSEQDQQSKIQQWQNALARARAKYEQAMAGSNITDQRISSELVELYRGLLQGEGHYAV